MAFLSLEQRMAQGYIDLFPQFIPDKNAPVSAAEQEAFYNLIKSLYKLAFDEPLLFVTSLHEDDAYPSRYKSSYGKPNLVADMKKFTKAIDTLLQNMFLLGQGEKVKLNKRQQAVLTTLGITEYSKLPAAWEWMATKNTGSLIAFSYCLFDFSYPYTSEIYARLLGEAAFRKLENWMLSNGYERFTIHNTTASDCKLNLTVANPKWNSTPPTGGFEYKIRHTGIAAQYDFYTKKPSVLGLCIPNGMKQYLEKFDEMESALQEFVAERTKKCDHCRYCVQTDKTGSRPLAYITVNFDFKAMKLCTYFPGYRYSWTSIDDELADKLIMMLSFMDKHIPHHA